MGMSACQVFLYCSELLCFQHYLYLQSTFWQVSCLNCSTLRFDELFGNCESPTCWLGSKLLRSFQNKKTRLLVNYRNVLFSLG